MSKIKSPAEKKRLSLTHDRRNNFGESPHASRKNIPKRKAAAHQQERRAANQALGEIFRDASVEALESTENEVQSRSKSKRLAGFRKWPDESLADSIKRKKARKIAAHERRKRINAA